LGGRAKIKLWLRFALITGVTGQDGLYLAEFSSKELQSSRRRTTVEPAEEAAGSILDDAALKGVRKNG
jgi:hypothetical protein